MFFKQLISSLGNWVGIMNLQICWNIKSNYVYQLTDYKQRVLSLHIACDYDHKQIIYRMASNNHDGGNKLMGKHNNTYLFCHRCEREQLFVLIIWVNSPLYLSSVVILLVEIQFILAKRFPLESKIFLVSIAWKYQKAIWCSLLT